MKLQIIAVTAPPRMPVLERTFDITPFSHSWEIASFVRDCLFAIDKQTPGVQGEILIQAATERMTKNGR